MVAPGRAERVSGSSRRRRVRRPSTVRRALCAPRLARWASCSVSVSAGMVGRARRKPRSGEDVESQPASRRAAQGSAFPLRRRAGASVESATLMEGQASARRRHRRRAAPRTNAVADVDGVSRCRFDGLGGNVRVLRDTSGECRGKPDVEGVVLQEDVVSRIVPTTSGASVGSPAPPDLARCRGARRSRSTRIPARAPGSRSPCEIESRAREAVAATGSARD